MAAIEVVNSVARNSQKTATAEIQIANKGMAIRAIKTTAVESQNFQDNTPDNCVIIDYAIYQIRITKEQSC